MRLWCCVLGASLLPACAAEYEGELFPRVVDARQMTVVDAVPSGARAIGVVSARSCVSSEGGEPLLCKGGERLTRRMKRAASRDGGEYLVDVHCVTTVREDVYDDPETWGEDVEVTCITNCDAEVARSWSHDR